MPGFTGLGNGSESIDASFIPITVGIVLIVILFVIVFKKK